MLMGGRIHFSCQFAGAQFQRWFAAPSSHRSASSWNHPNYVIIRHHQSIGVWNVSALSDFHFGPCKHGFTQFNPILCNLTFIYQPGGADSIYPNPAGQFLLHSKPAGQRAETILGTGTLCSLSIRLTIHPTARSPIHSKCWNNNFFQSTRK